MKTQNILKNMVLTVIYPHQNSQKKKKKINLSKKTIFQRQFQLRLEMMTLICPISQPPYKKSKYEYKNKVRITHLTKKSKATPYKNTTAKNKDTEQLTTIKSFPK